MRTIYNWAFKVGVLLSVLVFFAINVYSLMFPKKLLNNPFTSGNTEVGLPFSMFYSYLGNPNAQGVFPVGILMNAVVLVVSSLVFGFVFKFLAERFSEPE